MADRERLSRTTDRARSSPSADGERLCRTPDREQPSETADGVRTLRTGDQETASGKVEAPSAGGYVTSTSDVMSDTADLEPTPEEALRALREVAQRRHQVARYQG